MRDPSKHPIHPHLTESDVYGLQLTAFGVASAAMTAIQIAIETVEKVRENGDGLREAISWLDLADKAAEVMHDADGLIESIRHEDLENKNPHLHTG